MQDHVSAARTLRLATVLVGCCLVPGGPGSAHQAVDPAILRLVQPSPQVATLTHDQLVDEGERLFFEETFDGNGRTCGTCHRDDNNYTIDPRFIATLPASDPLFVAERNPALRTLENSRLLRRFGLITENLDGFNQPGVLRGVPHILGMSQSVKPDPNARGGIPFKLAGATGWSGDGAPGTGTLREFALGAIVQHFTKTLNRKVNVDYRVPTEEELDALLEFQLSVGRQAELKVDPALPGAIVFNDAHVEHGRALFHSAPARDGSTRACASCHVGGGANDATGGGGLFATGVENVANAPACLAPRQAPGDGGFGATPVQTVRASSICGRGSFDIVFRGTRGFNPPSLIEAADTLPLFHNNSAATLEDAVRFYTTDTFNRSPAGAGRAFVLDGAGINDVAAFLRGLNLLDNAREATRLIDEAERKPASEASDTILEARANALDAVEVLARSPVALFTTSRPARLFTSAARRLQDAAPTANVALMELARQDLARARDLIARNAPAGWRRAGPAARRWACRRHAARRSVSLGWAARPAGMEITGGPAS